MGSEMCIRDSNKTIIPLALVGYEMIIVNSAPRWLTIISYPTRARGIIVKYTPLLTLSKHKGENVHNNPQEMKITYCRGRKSELYSV